MKMKQCYAHIKFNYYLQKRTITPQKETNYYVIPTEPEKAIRNLLK